MSPLAWEGPVYPPRVLPAASRCSFSSWLALKCLTVLWCPARPFWGCSISTECVPSHPYTCSQIHCSAGRGSCKTALFWAISFNIYLKLEQVPIPAGNTMRVPKICLIPLLFILGLNSLGSIESLHPTIFHQKCCWSSWFPHAVALQEASSDICAGGTSTVLRLGLEMPEQSVWSYLETLLAYQWALLQSQAAIVDL